MTAQETQSSKKTGATYVVQLYANGGNWEDWKTVTMPPRSRRRSVIEKACAGEKLEGEQMVRVLDEGSAKTYTVKAKQQTTLEIG